MKSTSGVHYPTLDHIRALAAFLVVAWHFMHSATGYPVPFEGSPPALFALLDEGHTGVALFMTLSGYLFAKLIGDRRIIFSAFVLNRALRLVPLLAFVVAIVGIQRYLEGADMLAYLRRIMGGVVLPSLPNGGWSITVEAHFYVLLPLLLWVRRRSIAMILVMVLCAITLRVVLLGRIGEVQTLAYFTLIGRFDQFALGMLLFYARHLFKDRHAVAFIVATTFLAFYWWFDGVGGFMQYGGRPSASPLWIVLPTIEGAAYAVLIAWYDNSFSPSANGLSGVIARFGELSYSIYLLHFFFVWKAADLVHQHVMDISNFYVGLSWAAMFFALMYVPATLSYRFIELPALRARRPYILRSPTGHPFNADVTPNIDGMSKPRLSPGNRATPS